MFDQVIANIILWLHWSKMAPPDPFWIECHTGDSLLNLGDGNILTMSSSQHSNSLSDNTKEDRKTLLSNMAAVAIDLASISKFKTNLLKETIEGMIAKLSLEYSGSMLGMDFGLVHGDFTLDEYGHVTSTENCSCQFYNCYGIPCGHMWAVKFQTNSGEVRMFP
jgi:SWIM zinc finger